MCKECKCSEGKEQIMCGCDCHEVQNLRVFDAFEVQPCCETGHVNDDGGRCVEVCDEHEAEFWTVYGHFPTGGVIALADCPTEAIAGAIRDALKRYPRLLQLTNNVLVELQEFEAENMPEHEKEYKSIMGIE